jgi:hypothetical protein
MLPLLVKASVLVSYTQWSLCRLMRFFSTWCRAAEFFSASGASLSQEVPTIKWMSNEPALWIPGTCSLYFQFHMYTCIHTQAHTSVSWKSLSLSKCFHRLSLNVRWSDDLIFIIHFTDRIGVVVTLATRIREVLSSIFGRDIGNLNSGFSLFSSVPAGNSRNSTSVRPRPLPFKFFPIYRPSVFQQ